MVLYKALLRVTGTGPDEIVVTIPSWNPEERVIIKKNKIPEDIRQNLQIGTRLFAQVNIAAEQKEDLEICKFEPFES